MNPFLSNPRDRMKSWRSLRASLDATRTDAEHLMMVADHWSKAPITTPYMDYTEPQTWPDPWTLVDSGDFDQNTVGLGMFHTLVLCVDNRWDNRLRLCMIRDPDASIERLMVIADDRYLLNHHHGLVSTWPQSGRLSVMHDYCYDRDKRIIHETSRVHA